MEVEDQALQRAALWESIQRLKLGFMCLQFKGYIHTYCWESIYKGYMGI